MSKWEKQAEFWRSVNFFKIIIIIYFFFEQEGNKTQVLINGLTWQFFAFVVTYSFFSQSFW